MMAPPDGRSWGHFVVGLLLHVVVFVVVGPLVGTLVVSLVAGVAGPGGIRGAAAGLFASFALYFITLPVGYYLGWKAACLTGAAVALMSVFVRPPFLFYVSAILLGACGALLFVQTKGEVGALVAVTMAGAVAAAICTKLTNWIRMPSLPGLVK